LFIGQMFWMDGAFNTGLATEVELAFGALTAPRASYDKHD